MLPVAQSILRNLAYYGPLMEQSPTATAVVTATAVTEATPVVEASPTPLPPVPTSLPTPLPSPWSPDQWLKGFGWTADFHGAFLFFYLLIAIAAVVVYFYLFRRRFKNHALHARLAERASLILTIFATVGLLLLFFAIANVPLLSMPLWLILSMVAFIALCIYAVYYYVSFYPALLLSYQREQERVRYLPKARSKGPAYTPPMKRKQKQSRQEKRKAR